jgi:hypothetical protein
MEQAGSIVSGKIRQGQQQTHQLKIYLNYLQPQNFYITLFPTSKFSNRKINLISFPLILANF